MPAEINYRSNTKWNKRQTKQNELNFKQNTGWNKLQTIYRMKKTLDEIQSEIISWQNTGNYRREINYRQNAREIKLKTKLLAKDTMQNKTKLQNETLTPKKIYTSE